jgi:hypothetical protein
VIGSSLDGRSIIVNAAKPLLVAPLPPDSFGQAEDKLLAVVTPQTNPFITFYINNMKWKTVNPSLIEPNNALWVPMREVLETAGWKISWQKEGHTIIGEKSGRTDRVFKFAINRKAVHS